MCNNICRKKGKYYERDNTGNRYIKAFQLFKNNGIDYVHVLWTILYKKYKCVLYTCIILYNSNNVVLDHTYNGIDYVYTMNQKVGEMQ